MDCAAALHRYSDRVMHVMLNLLKHIFPKFSAHCLANRKCVCTTVVAFNVFHLAQGCPNSPAHLFPRVL